VNRINVLAWTGILTTDPELRETGFGTAATTLRLANRVRRRIGSEWDDETSYFDVEVWDPQAETCAANLGKGSRVGVQGEIEIDQWTDAGGERRNKPVIRQASVTFEGRRLSSE
jgi:single-strand DNA-binding protein